MSVSSAKLINPHLEAEKLLKMPVTTAEVLFQGYTIDQQLEVISSIRDAKAREELYYLVPDCTELIQMSPTEDVLQILDTRLGTGTASALLPCLSSDQFEEMMDFVLWRNGKLDERTLDLWLFELSECEIDELGDLLSQIDVGILGSLLRGRVVMDEEFKALFIEEGLVDPSTPGIDYSDERARAVVDAIWGADADLFVRLLYELFGLDREDELGEELWGSLDRAKEEQEERVRERDKAAGIDITEAEILEKVDLDQLDLEDKKGSKVDEESEDA
jgi:hypothetical protein